MPGDGKSESSSVLGSMRTTSRIKTITVNVTETLSANVAIANKRRSTRLEVGRKALLAYEGDDRPSFADAAARFLGTAKGPGDLSTNRKYMKGYGK